MGFLRAEGAMPECLRAIGARLVATIMRKSGMKMADKDIQAGTGRCTIRSVRDHIVNGSFCFRAVTAAARHVHKHAPGEENLLNMCQLGHKWPVTIQSRTPSLSLPPGAGNSKELAG